MSDDGGNGESSGLDVDAILQQLKGEFIGETGERLDRLELQLETWRAGKAPDADILAEVRREAHTIKGLGGTFGFPVMSVIAHRLEDYLANRTTLTERHVADAYRFVDALRGVIEGGDDPGDDAAQVLLASLPAKWSPEVAAGAPGSVEVLAGVNSLVLQKALDKELYALAYRVTSTRSALDVLKIAVMTRPNAVIVSGVMDVISGLDIVRALSAMDHMAGIPMALLTSTDDKDLHRIPKGTVIIHPDPAHFADGLAELASKVKVRKVSPKKV